MSGYALRTDPTSRPISVIPAQAGIQQPRGIWIPACAGMTIAVMTTAIYSIYYRIQPLKPCNSSSR
ncbi:hypothetical protein D6C00_13430 [Thiohalobacter thiocyanaticus]|uniref:Uncharacterized protein n=1 Tax=Thiohalobacter thiocyanaticus TaxID=585455 RepID=A0A426QM36_9GAMM|nr:hypothetical protein D6C00_13430 [Thiohalobacter thiocyanaticus]